ncbi:MAG: SusC/RagA family TonB-linked outer membrane protein, partial [Mangrovibacterium sp.]
ASNGVIIITTKQGKLNQPLKVTVDSKLMISQPTNTVSVMNASQFTDFVNTYGSDADKARLGTSSTDWQDQIYRTAVSSDNNVSLTGSIKNLPIRASLGYIAQQGILDTDAMNRFTSALNLAPSFFDNHLKTELNAKYTYVANDFANRDAIGAAVAFDPTQSVYDEDGAYTTWYAQPGVRNSNTTANPLMLLHSQEDLGNVNRFIGNAKFDYKLHFLPDFTATLNVGYDRASSSVEKYKTEGWIDTEPGRTNDESYTEAMNENKLLDLYLNYNKTIGEHRINATGGYAYQSFYSESATENFSYYSDETKNTHNIATPSKNKDVLISFFARANYSLKERYLFTATLRADASSKLNPDDRWGVFPSASFAWRISEENFLKNVSALSNLKLRLGYGQMGNVGNLGNYKYLTRYTSSANDQAQYQIGDDYYSAYRPEVSNKDLRWEIGETYNVGIDYGFLDERLTGAVDYYIKNTNDLIASQKLDPFTNFGSAVEANIGDIKNEGVELALNYEIIRKDEFNWAAGVNASYNKNEITYLPNEELVGAISAGTGNKVQIRRQGVAANSFYVYEQAYDSKGNPLENIFVDRNDDGLINESDRYIYNSADPSWVFGFFSTANYKNWDFSMTARASLDNYSYFDIAAANSTISQAFAHSSLSNRHSYFYNARFHDQRDQQVMSDMYIQNASFFKLDNITLGYRISKDKLKFADLRLYGSIQNVWTITKYDGVDPENGGIDGKFYSIPTIYTFGLTLNL